MRATNIFGGKNARSLYVPMSELEQEAVLRLVESKDLRVNLVGWGHVDNPRVTFGDARVQVKFQVHFDRPETPVPVHFFDLELVTKTGRLIFRARQSTEYAGNPIQVASGVFLAGGGLSGQAQRATKGTDRVRTGQDRVLINTAEWSHYEHY